MKRNKNQVCFYNLAPYYFNTIPSFMKRLTVVLLAYLISFSSFAQEKEKTPIGGRPDIKGDLSIDIGFNTLNNKPDELATSLFPSRTFNISYQFPVKLFGENSGVTFNPGLGLGLDKFAFKGNQNLFNDPLKGPTSSQLLEVKDVYGDEITIGKNNVALNYVDIPLEFRYHFNKTNYDKGMRIAVGGKIGFLFDSQTKISYTDENDLERKIKDKQSYGINPIRYGILARIGTAGLNVWGYYGLNEVFSKDKGPFNSKTNQINFGLSVALF